MELPQGLRVIRVNERIGYFHCWEQRQTGEVIHSDPNRKADLTGATMEVVAIVEFEDGVERVNPTDVEFADEKHQTLRVLNKAARQKK